MKKLLFVNACVRGDISRTLILAKEYLKYKNLNNEYEVIEMDLRNIEISYLQEKDFKNEEIGIFKNEEYAKQFANVDEILISAPFWEFTFPAVLSCYIEMISKAGVTFEYTDTGSKGLCKAKLMTYIYTSGDYITKEDDIGSSLLKRLCGLYGIREFNSYYAQGLDIEGNDIEKIIATALDKIKNDFSSKN